jgi:hypothetical protein
MYVYINDKKAAFDKNNKHATKKDEAFVKNVRAITMAKERYTIQLYL